MNSKLIICTIIIVLTYTTCVEARRSHKSNRRTYTNRRKNINHHTECGYIRSGRRHNKVGSEHYDSANTYTKQQIHNRNSVPNLNPPAGYSQQQKTHSGNSAFTARSVPGSIIARRRHRHRHRSTTVSPISTKNPCLIGGQSGVNCEGGQTATEIPSTPNINTNHIGS